MRGGVRHLPARHRKASSEAEPLQPEGTSLEVIPHHVSRSGVSVERVANLGVGGGRWDVIFSSHPQHAASISQHFFGWWTMHRARKGLGLHIQFQGRAHRVLCGVC